MGGEPRSVNINPFTKDVLTNEEQYLFDSIKAARNVQEFLWGDFNKEWSIDEWRLMFKKRMKKIDDIDPNKPHAKIELKKRILQNAALSIALLNIIDNGLPEQCDVESNLKEYE